MATDPPAATLQAFLGGTTAGLPQILRTTGDATVDTGTLEVVVGGGFVGAQTFTILRSDTNLIGTFSDVILPADPGIGFGALVYDAAANTLSIPVFAAPYTRNQSAVAAYLGAAEAAGASPALQSVIDGLNLLDYTSFRIALDQLHPEAYDAHTASLLELGHRFTQNLLERPRYCVAAPDEHRVDPRTNLTCRERRLEAWVSLYGQRGNRDGAPGQISWEDEGAGLMLGVDRRFSEHFLMSASIGGAYDSIDVLGVGRGRFRTLDLGVYAGYTRGPVRVQGVLAYGRGWQDQARTVRIPGFARTSNGSWGTNRVGVRLDGEYAFDVRGWTLAPMASLDYTGLGQEQITETGAAPVSLLVDSRTDHIVTIRVGGEVSTALAKRDYYSDLLEAVDGVWRPTLSVRWRQVVSGADRGYTARFLGTPATTVGKFVVAGDGPDKGFEVGAGLDWTPEAANRLTFGLRYDVFAWEGVTTHDLAARVRFSFY